MATRPRPIARLLARPTRFTRLSVARTSLAVLCAAVVAVGLLPSAGQAAPQLTLSQVQTRLDQLNTEAESAQEAANAASVAAATAQRSLDQANASLKKAQVAVSDAERFVGQLAAAAYRNGGVDVTLQLLVADDPSQFVAQASAMEGVDRHQAEVLRAAAAGQQRLAQAKLVVQQQLDQLNALKTQALAHQNEVQAKVDEGKALLASLQASQRAELLAAQNAKAAAERAANARAAASHRVTRSGGHTGGSPGHIPSLGGSGIGHAAASYAMSKVGDSYVWGATGPGAFDCSGLTMMAYRAAGVSLPHSSSAQYGSGQHISASSLQPGDLVFYYSPIHHVGIYIGGGMIVHAANPGSGVQYASLYSMPFSGAVRPY